MSKDITEHDKLVSKIADAHRRAVSRAERCIDAAIDVGRFLVEAKEQLPHGNWAAWVRKHCDFGPRQARKYIRMYHHRDEIENGTGGSDLSINRALKIVAQEHEPERQSQMMKYPEVDFGRSEIDDDLTEDEEIRESEERMLRYAMNTDNPVCEEFRRDLNQKLRESVAEDNTAEEARRYATICSLLEKLDAIVSNHPEWLSREHWAVVHNEICRLRDVIESAVLPRLNKPK